MNICSFFSVWFYYTSFLVDLIFMIKKIGYFFSDFTTRFIAATNRLGVFNSLNFLITEFYYDRKLAVALPTQDVLTEVNENSILKDSNRNVSGSYFLFFRGIKQAGILPPDSHFIDIGCGNGKILCAAISLNFKKVTGIDLDKHGLVYADLVAKAISKKYIKTELEILNTDAAVYNFASSINVVFFFNPFGEKTMKQVINNLMKSLELHPRKISVIYQRPDHEHLFIDAGFQLVKRTVWNKKQQLSVFVWNKK